MKNLNTLFLLLGLFVIIGCNKDENENPNTPDPCEGVTCLNDGECANGECNCPEGFGGSDCSVVQTPTTMRITKIVVQSFPPTAENGGGWDTNSGADLFPVVIYGSFALYNFEDNEIVNASPSGSNTFVPTAPIEINFPDEANIVRLYDKDGFANDDDYISGIEYTPFLEFLLFPEVRTLEVENTIIDIHFTYQF
jgi:hypothetical protein